MTEVGEADELHWKPLKTEGARIDPLSSGGWRLEIPAGPQGRYRLAQLDDYDSLPREKFLWRAAPGKGVALSLNARASSAELPGTWGFGLWNDPFSLSLGLGGGIRRFPAMPNAAWYFFASDRNYLSIYDNLPACGALAATFQSARLPTFLLALALPAMTLFLVRPLARMLRKLGRRFVKQSARQLDLDSSAWHTYELTWRAYGVSFRVDQSLVHETHLAPSGPLGLVLWIDNQFAALTPAGQVQYGTEPNETSAWIEIKDISLSSVP